jgi:hypothetical protein
MGAERIVKEIADIAVIADIARDRKTATHLRRSHKGRRLNLEFQVARGSQ